MVGTLKGYDRMTRGREMSTPLSIRTMRIIQKNMAPSRAAFSSSIRSRKGSLVVSSSGSRAPPPTKLFKEEDWGKSHWDPVIDKSTGGTYYFNKMTNEVTALNEPRPDTWVAVNDPATSLVYYHNPVTDETTQVGVPKPPRYRVSTLILPTSSQPPQFSVNTLHNRPATTFAGGMIQYVVLGAGMTFGMVAIRVLLGI